MGGATHVGWEEFLLAAGVKMNHIPFKGGADALAAVLGGHVQVLVDSSSWAPHVRDGKLRLLATWGEQRTKEFKDVPTLKESGIDLEFTNWRGVVAPPGISEEDKAVWIDAFTKMHASAGTSDSEGATRRSPRA